MEEPSDITGTMYWFPYGALREFTLSVIDEFYAIVGALERQGLPKPLTTRALWTWSKVLGTLACDLATSGIRSIDAGDLRVATLINRSLYEYVNRLRYFGAHTDDAIKCCQEGVKFYDRMHEVVYSDYIEDVPPLDPANKMDMKSITGMLTEYLKRATIDGESAARYRRHFHDGFYAAASALAHGSQGAIMDAYQVVEMGEKQKLIWMKRHDENLRPPAMCTMVLMLILMIAAIEDFNIVAVRPKKWRELVKQYRVFAQELLQFKERHAEQVGHFQMCVDTFGT